MKLKTLLEMQRCFAMLREAETAHISLTGRQYVECVSAQSVFDYELKQHIEAMPAVEITNDERYKFLRDEFALKATDDEAEFAKLAHVSGAEFDAAVDKAIGAAA